MTIWHTWLCSSIRTRSSRCNTGNILQLGDSGSTPGELRGKKNCEKKIEPTFPAAASVAMRLAFRRATLCMERRNGWGIKRGLQMLRVWEDGKSSCCQRRQLSRFPKFDRSFNRLRMRPDQLGRAHFHIIYFPNGPFRCAPPKSPFF